MVIWIPGLRKKIQAAIVEAEKSTSGEIRVHVRRRSSGDVFKDAQKMFWRLNMHRTSQRNAVLIFVALDSRRFAVVGDEGIHQKAGQDFWNQVRDTMQKHFESGSNPDAIIAGVRLVGQCLKSCFPRKPFDKNELSNNLTSD